MYIYPNVFSLWVLFFKLDCSCKGFTIYFNRIHQSLTLRRKEAQIAPKMNHLFNPHGFQWLFLLSSQRVVVVVTSTLDLQCPTPKFQ